MSLSYFDIFPDAKLSASVKPKEDNQEFEITPFDVANIIKHYLIDTKRPNWIEISHTGLCHHLFFLVFDGLDNSRYNIFKDDLSAFHSISENGFPVMVLAREKNRLIVPAINSVLGYSSHSKKKEKFNSLEEMCLSLEERYDNGYPIKPGCQPNLNRTLRCSYFGMAVLTNEELALFDTLPDETEGALPVIGIDCEMIKTTCGEELARISCVDENGEIVIDEYFQPVGEVIDYRTQFSGISKETLQSVTLKSTDLLSILSKKADSHTIIIGHSLENDLRAMKIIHDKVIDTALVYNSDTKYPTKPGLAKLYQKYIKKPFRESGEGHDSAEDARAALELAKNALNYAVHEIKVDAKLPQLFTDLLPSVAAINVFAPAFACPYENIEPKVHCTVKDTNAEIAVELINSIENDPPRLTYSYFYSLSRCELTEESEKEAAAEYNRILGNVLERLPSYSVLMVYTANGNLKRLRNNEGKPMSFDDPAFVAEFALCKQGLLWVYSKTK